MFTSRAENRLKLREDNADARLTPHGYTLGLIDSNTYQTFKLRQEQLDKEHNRIQTVWLNPTSELNFILTSFHLPPLTTHVTLASYLKRPEVNVRNLKEAGLMTPHLDLRVLRRLEIDVKYEGYIKREEHQSEKRKHFEHVWIPKDVNYEEISGLSKEVVEKLKKHSPSTLGQASRISGMTPAAITLLHTMIQKRKPGKTVHEHSCL
jgi:tRNA uridine 5-carboxymethylaminomethyl modification enzyme